MHVRYSAEHSLFINFSKQWRYRVIWHERFAKRCRQLL